MNKKMPVTYAGSEEKFAKSVVLHAHSDNVLYLDADHTIAVTHDELLNLCLKGLLIVKKDDTYYAPIHFKENASEIDVLIATDMETGTTVKSKSTKD